MGKIRVRTLGNEDQEQLEKNQAKKKQEAKKTAKASGMKGGERVVVDGQSRLLPGSTVSIRAAAPNS